MFWLNVLVILGGVINIRLLLSLLLALEEKRYNSNDGLKYKNIINIHTLHITTFHPNVLKIAYLPRPEKINIHFPGCKPNPQSSLTVRLNPLVIF